MINSIQFLKRTHIHALLFAVANRIILLLAGCIMWMHSQSQDKNLVLADQYFAAGEYYTAANLYEQFLHPTVKQKPISGFPLNSGRRSPGSSGKPVNKLDILYKQAESYRLANYWPQASARYKECFEKDQVKYADGLYWYAACQRSIGNYTEAEEMLKIFLSSYAAGTPYQQAAEKESETLQFIKSQLARPDSILYRIQKISTSFGTEKGVYAPVATMNNRFLITSTHTDPVVKTGINPFHNRLFNAALADDGLQNITAVNIENLDSSLNQGTASLSNKGNYLYFTQWKKEKGQNISSVYYAVKKGNRWGTPVLVPLVSREGYNSKQPFYSADEKYLFFASDRPGGYGGFDIWYAPLQTDGTIGEPVNAGAVLNTAANEQSPFYHSSSGTLVFSSNRTPAMGGYDLFAAKGWETEWKTPENIGHPVNSSRDDLYFFAPQNETLLSKAIVSSDRGSDCCLEIYMVSKTPKKKKIKGVILDCRNDEPLAGAEVVMKNTMGDSLRTITGKNGIYEFDLNSNTDQQQLFISKELYKEKSAGIVVDRINETDWLTDVLLNTSVCLEKKLVIKLENVVTVYFDFDKSDLETPGIAQLDSIYNVLMENSIATIQISGYTDGRGSEEYNKKLSDRRAKACADYLIQKGIDSSRISFESFGACCPVEMELINGRDNPDGRSKNRRALINISKE